MSTARDELLQLVRSLEEDSAEDVLDYVRWLLSEEDEPLTPEERTEIERAEAEIARGEYVTLDQAERELGL